MNTYSRRPRIRTLAAMIAVVASILFAGSTAYGQPVGFGNATNLGTLRNQASGWNLWANHTVRSTPGVVGYHTYRFDVAGSQMVTVTLTAPTKTVAVVLFNSSGQPTKIAGNNDPKFTVSMSAGTYYLRTIANPNTTTSYRLTVNGMPNVIIAPRPVLRTPTVINAPKPAPQPAPAPAPPVPQPKPVTRISYGGFVFDNHSANTTLSPTTINVGGTFRVTSTTMSIPSNARVFVTLVDVNRVPGSAGVTRFSLQRFSWSGRTLTIAGPDLALFRNRSFYVEISTWENGLPKNYAMPGIIKIQ